MRILLLWFMITYMVIIVNCGFYGKYFKYHLLVFSIVLALFSWERELVYLEWKSAFYKFWYKFWLMACVSDFVVSKNTSFVGYVMIFFFGFFMFVWQQMKQPIMIIDNLMSAIDISYYICLGCCILLRTWNTEENYTGCFKHPTIFALYLIVALTVQLQKSYQYLKEEKSAHFIVRCGLITTVWFFIEITQCWSVFLLGLMNMLIFGIKSYAIIEGRYQVKYVVAKVWQIMIAVGVTLVVCYAGVAYTPSGLKVEVEYEDEVVLDNTELISDLTGGSMECLSDSRNLTWIGYVRALNLYGHNGNASINDESIQARNAILTIAYRYGIFAVIPFAGVFLCSLQSMIKLFGKNNQRNFFMAGILLSGIVLSLWHNVEPPLSRTIWIVLFLCVGYLLVMKEEEQD